MPRACGPVAGCWRPRPRQEPAIRRTRQHDLLVRRGERHSALHLMRQRRLNRAGHVAALQLAERLTVPRRHRWSASPGAACARKRREAALSWAAFKQPRQGAVTRRSSPTAVKASCNNDWQQVHGQLTSNARIAPPAPPASPSHQQLGHARLTVRPTSHGRPLQRPRARHWPLVHRRAARGRSGLGFAAGTTARSRARSRPAWRRGARGAVRAANEAPGCASLSRSLFTARPVPLRTPPPLSRSEFGGATARVPPRAHSAPSAGPR